MEEPEAIYQLIIKYLSGEATENETLEVLNWINSSDKNKELYFKIKDISDTVKGDDSNIQPVLDIWEQQVLSRNSAIDKKADKLRRYVPNYLKYAAAIIISLSCAVFYKHYANTPKQIVVISVAKNQPTRQIQLPDHSSVWLKSGSSISYAANFNQTGRLVNLTGDAFFEVTKVLDNTGHRKSFTVQTSKMNISVRGTSFNIKDEGGQYGVVVRTGVVRVESNAQVKMLHPGDRVQLKGNQLMADRVNADLYQGWITGEYKFNNTSVQEIKELLQVNSNCVVEIIQAEKFKNFHLSGRIMAPDEATLLNILGVMLKASVSKSNNIITIKPVAYD